MNSTSNINLTAKLPSPVVSKEVFNSHGLWLLHVLLTFSYSPLFGTDFAKTLVFKAGYVEASTGEAVGEDKR
jgi:hypothetical protein